MKKNKGLGLFTEPKVPAEKQKEIALSAEQHIDSLRRGQARTLLAWSYHGTIAFVPPCSDIVSSSSPIGEPYGSSPRLYATVPTYDIASKKTHLLEAVSQAIPVENVPIDHIVFNEAGTLLTVVDELGTITIWEQDSISAQFNPRQSFPSENPDGLQASGRIVNLRWLHSETKVNVAVKLIKAGDQWSCQSSSQRGSGPCNAAGKESFVAVTSDGRMKVIFQTPRGWKSETLVLDGGEGETYGETIGVLTDSITHAAWTQDFFAPGSQGMTKDHNMIGLAVVRRDPAIGQCVSYYKVTIDFKADQENPVKLGAALLVNRDPLDLGGELTHVFVLPTSHTSGSALAAVTLQTDEFGERKSSLALWDITKSTTALHATFSHLSSVTSIPAPKDEAYSISLKQRVTLPGIVISADIRIYSSWITLGYLDGSVEVRKRTSIDKPESPAEDSKNIMSIFDGGFYFPKPENSDDRYIATCLSPNTAAYASLHASGQVKLHPMQSDQASLISTVLAQKFTISLKKNVTFDDLFLVVEQYLNEEFAAKLLSQILKFSSWRFETGKEMPFEAIVNQHIWSKLVSIQYNLQSRLPHGTKIASNSILLLHVRQMFLSFMVSVKMDALPGGRGTKPQNVGKFWLSPKPFPIPMEIHFREYSIVALLGYVQWLMDYLVFVVRELLLVAKDLRQKHYEKDADIPTMSAMIFTSVVRMFLRAGIRGAADLVSFAKRYVEQGVDVEPIHVHAYSMLDSMTRQSPISLEFAAKFLEEIDQIMDKIMSEPQNQQIKQDIENKLFLESLIPRPLRKAIYTVTDRLIGPQSPLDIPTIIFYDVTWLGFSDTRAPAAQYVYRGANEAVWDTLRKQRLFPGKVKKCNRCGMLCALDDPPVVQELLKRTQPPQQPIRHWTYMFTRNCLCYGTWTYYELE